LSTPALLVPLAASFSEKWRMPSRWVVSSMLLSAALSGLWMLAGKNGEYWLGVQPIYVGLFVAVGCFIFSKKSTHIPK
jgi:hypothetical protein